MSVIKEKQTGNWPSLAAAFDPKATKDPFVVNSWLWWKAHLSAEAAATITVS